MCFVDSFLDVSMVKLCHSIVFILIALQLIYDSATGLMILVRLIHLLPILVNQRDHRPRAIRIHHHQSRRHRSRHHHSHRHHSQFVLVFELVL
jgi:hypothetical protein